ncbi:DUF3108 domain-containing protein [Alloalcanivorax mobilis]|uniref:DUF3108 domain-containing protein n=1 Tax=Alloalcanivorax mobilis TaxID=2019569 RepID=UPI0013000032|nr:DUF3108 domain-containing protein [Alloalcanivorax mobilis]
MANVYPHKAGKRPWLRWLSATSAVLAVLLLPAAASAEPPLAAFSSQYRLKAAGFPFSVSAMRTLKPLDNGDWRMEVLAHNFIGEIRETSVFTWRGCTPVTHYYGYLRKGLGQVKSAEVRISDGQATSERSEHQPARFAVDRDASDKIAMTLALQCRLARGDQDLTVKVVDEREQEVQHYEVQGRETLKLGDLKLDTVKVHRVRAGTSKRQTWLWFAPQRGYELVQMVQENSDGRHVLTLEPSP